MKRSPHRVCGNIPRGIFLEGIASREVSCAAEAKELLNKGTSERCTYETRFGTTGSRMHTLFQVCLTQQQGTAQTVARANFVALAGCEKYRQVSASKSEELMKESMSISLTLGTLRRVFDVIIDNGRCANPKNRKLPPFRESLLTYVLSDAMGANSKHTIIAVVSPHASNVDDTLDTLRFVKGLRVAGSAGNNATAT